MRCATPTYTNKPNKPRYMPEYTINISDQMLFCCSKHNFVFSSPLFKSQPCLILVSCKFGHFKKIYQCISSGKLKKTKTKWCCRVLQLDSPHVFTEHEFILPHFVQNVSSVLLDMIKLDPTSHSSNWNTSLYSGINEHVGVLASCLRVQYVWKSNDVCSGDFLSAHWIA